MRLLIVEDSERLRRSLATGLRRSRYAVDVAGDGEEGLWYARTNDYDAIILDLMLPGLLGAGSERHHPADRERDRSELRHLRHGPSPVRERSGSPESASAAHRPFS